MLADDGFELVGPVVGPLASGEVGMGRMVEVEALVAAVERAASGGRLRGARALVTAGPTHEPVDPVRFLGNRSSGKMGFTIADAARARGAEVTVIAANVTLPRRNDVTYVEVNTADELRIAARSALKSADVVIMAAAVADYRSARTAEGKIDTSDAPSLTLELERTTDILRELSELRGSQILVGFAAEHGENGLERARAKRARKDVDLLVHNDVSIAGIGFGADENAITIIGDGPDVSVPRTSKRECAERILDAVAVLRSGRA